VDGGVEGAVAAAVESVSHGASGAGRDGVDPGEGGEGGLVAEAAFVGPGGQGDGGADRADAGLGEQGGAYGLDQCPQLFEVGGQGPVEGGDVAGQGGEAFVADAVKG